MSESKTEFRRSLTITFDEALRRITRKLAAASSRPGELNRYMWNPDLEEWRMLELQWIERYGDDAMAILHQEALDVEAGQEWQRWEAEAEARIEEVFHA